MAKSNCAKQTMNNYNLSHYFELHDYLLDQDKKFSQYKKDGLHGICIHRLYSKHQIEYIVGELDCFCDVVKTYSYVTSKFEDFEYVLNQIKRYDK